MCRKWIYLVTCCCLTSLVEAKDINVSVFVKRIEQMQFLDKDSDYLYFQVGENLAKKQYFNYQVPHFPDSWSSTRLGKIKNIPVWQDRLSEGKEDIIEVALMDRRLILDQYLGGIHLKLLNKHGQLVTEWSRKDQRIKHIVNSQNSHTIVFSSEKNQYKVHFQLNYAAVESAKEENFVIQAKK